MSEKIRYYFVIDMKSFYASVECAERGLDPMETKLVVADEEKSENTICLAVSPALKKLNVKNRCRLFEVPKNIDFIIAKPRMKKYIEYATEIYGIYLNYFDKNDIHTYSIDESFIDVTDYLKLYKIELVDLAKKLMQEIDNKLHIPSSCGIGTNLYLAKIALDITAKHNDDRIGFLDENKFIETLWKHRPIEDFWQISTGTANRLKKYLIYDMEGIAKSNYGFLYKEFGINAELLIDHSFGKESCLMEDIKTYKTKYRSISSSQILSYNYRYKDAKIVMEEMIQESCYLMAKEKLITSKLVLNIGYGDDRTSVKGSKRLNCATNLYSKILPYAELLFDEIVERDRPVRKISFDFSYIMPLSMEYYDFFSDYTKIQKEKNLVNSVIEIKERYGKNSLLKGIDLSPNATQRQRNNQIGGHNSGTKENG